MMLNKDNQSGVRISHWRMTFINQKVMTIEICLSVMLSFGRTLSKKIELWLLKRFVILLESSSEDEDVAVDVSEKLVDKRTQILQNKGRQQQILEFLKSEPSSYLNVGERARKREKPKESIVMAESVSFLITWWDIVFSFSFHAVVETGSGFQMSCNKFIWIKSSSVLHSQKASAINFHCVL